MTNNEKLIKELLKGEKSGIVKNYNPKLHLKELNQRFKHLK